MRASIDKKDKDGEHTQYKNTKQYIRNIGHHW